MLISRLQPSKVPPASRAGSIRAGAIGATEIVLRPNTPGRVTGELSQFQRFPHGDIRRPLKRQ